jgi:exonuclease SbcC
LHVLEVDRTRLEADLVVARLKVETCQQHWSTVASDLRRQITDGDTALGGRPEIKKALLELVDLRMKDRDLIALRDKKEAVERQRRDLELSFNRQRSEIQVEIETRKSRRRDLQSLLDHRTELDRTFNDARQHLETFRALNEEMERVKREGTESQQTEDRLKERLEDLGQRRQQWVAQATQLKDHDDPDCPLCGSELDENHRLEVLAQLGKEMEELGWEHKAVTRNLTDAKGRRDACRSAYQKLRDQVHPLGDAPRKFAQAEAALAQVSKVDEDLEILVGGIQELEDRAKTFEASSDIAIELSQIRERIERLSAETRQHDAVRTRIETLAPAELESVKLDEIQSQVDAVRAQLPEAEQKYLAATEWLEGKRYASGIQKHLAELSAKAEAIGYDGETHDATLKLIENLTGSEKELGALQDAERDLAVARTKMEAADIRRNEIVVAMRDAEEALLQFRDIDETREMLSGHKDRLSTQLTEFRSSRDSALREVATLERDEEACLQLEAQREDTSTQLARFEKDATLYRELVKAFGRDGIQALMIDQAIPELQDEANRILSRLTANGTQITLESLSELKSGGTRETLDIRISDELGERKYELYSGGEAFRVDFAIRIALSKLLARRSGTPLQTLVIDEGFGTQDEEGLTHLIEAIQTISDEFEKVLVITHLDVIKNAFPVRIEVIKHADSGSTFTVVS